VEGRLERVERALGLPGSRSAAILGDLPVAVLALPRPGARVEAARDLLADPAATGPVGATPVSAPTGAPAALTPRERPVPAAPSASSAPGLIDLLSSTTRAGAPPPPRAPHPPIPTPPLPLILRPFAAPHPGTRPAGRPSPGPARRRGWSASSA
jgi:hypothetical protein